MRRKALGGLIALTLAGLVLVLAVSAGGAAGGHGKGKGHNESAPNGRTGFHFLVLDAAGTSDRLIIQGDGWFGPERAHGGGTFDHFLAGTAPPAPLVATGTWKATGDATFTTGPNSTHGVYEGGVLTMHATLKPIGKPAINNVLIEVDCNLGPAGFSTGKPEGVVVTIPGPPQVVFAPTNPTTGVTVFSVVKGHADEGGH